MGLGTYPFVRENPKNYLIFQYVDFTFLVIYTIELLMQFIYHGVGLFSDGWLLFDLFIVASSWAYESITVVRAFRIFRAVKILRALRLVGRFKPLRDVILAVISVVPSMINITFLLLFTFYINAVLFTSLFKDMYEKGQTSENYFSRLDLTSFTLFQVMCIDDWSEIAREIMAVYRWGWVPFLIFLFITTYGLMSMFIAIFCTSIDELKKSLKKKKITELSSKAEDFEVFQVEMRQIIEQMNNLSKSQMQTIRRINELVPIVQENDALREKDNMNEVNE